MKGRLNLFQRTMLRWREFHPYSAVHVVRIDRPLDAARLASSLERTLGALGLTGLELDIDREQFEYRGGPANPSIAIYRAEGSPIAVLKREIERELNTPFTRNGRMNPFRFLAIETSPSSFYLGLAYDHFIAGGDSIVLLLRSIVASYTDAVNETATKPYVRYPASFRTLFVRHFWSAIRGVGALGDLVSSCRRSVRPPYAVGADPHNGFAYCRLEQAEFTTLIRTARGWAVTVNDLLMALLLQQLAPLAGERNPGHRRHELAVASIVNLRRDMALDLNTTFGQFLSSLRVSHPFSPGTSLRQLAIDIAAKTARIKQRKLYLQSLIALAVTGAAWRFLLPAEREVYYARNYPVWGGITLLDVDPLWAQAGGSIPLPEYLRAVSTGPLSPIVVAVTTAAGVLHAGISYRTSTFTSGNIDRIAAGIVAGARQLAT